jgi:hypothetical protein
VGSRRPTGRLGPDRRLRLVVATTDPAGLPVHSSWYLLTNLARPASRRAQRADLAEVVRLYGLRNWVEQGDRQVKGELGWAGFQVRSDRAICRHWTLVAYAFSFCWQTWFCQPRWATGSARPPAVPTAARGATAARHRRRTSRQQLVAGGGASGTGLADPWSVLQRCWRSWSPAPPPRQLQRLLYSVAAGQPLHPHIPP